MDLALFRARTSPTSLGTDEATTDFDSLWIKYRLHRLRPLSFYRELV
jgi:hypothetical protein